MDGLLHVPERATATLLDDAFHSCRGRRRVSGWLLIPQSDGFLSITLIGLVFRSRFTQRSCSPQNQSGQDEYDNGLCATMGVVYTHRARA